LEDDVAVFVVAVNVILVVAVVCFTLLL